MWLKQFIEERGFGRAGDGEEGEYVTRECRWWRNRGKKQQVAAIAEKTYLKPQTWSRELT